MEEKTTVSRTDDMKARPILYSGLAAGVLDGLAATVNSALNGVTPDRVFQYIASGMLGRSAFAGGAATAALGVLLHFVVAFGAAAVFFAGVRFVPALNRYPFIFGPLYGVVVYFVMREIVSPLSLVTRAASPTISGTIIGIIIHILFVGLPIALIQRSRNRER